MKIKIRKDKKVEIDMKDQLLKALETFGEEVSIVMTLATRKL